MSWSAWRIGAASLEGPAAAADLAEVARLFRAYAGSLDVDLRYQDFETEVATLPGRYAPPGGTLLIARDRAGTALGCVALRPLDEPGLCEMKRLYLVGTARGMGVGRALVDAVTAVARSLGYREIRLDTLPSMRTAARLYEAAGFRPVPAYYDTPVAGTLFFAKSL